MPSTRRRTRQCGWRNRVSRDCSHGNEWRSVTAHVLPCRSTKAGFYCNCRVGVVLLLLFLQLCADGDVRRKLSIVKNVSWQFFLQTCDTSGNWQFWLDKAGRHPVLGRDPGLWRSALLLLLWHDRPTVQADRRAAAAHLCRHISHDLGQNDHDAHGSRLTSVCRKLHRLRRWTWVKAMINWWYICLSILPVCSLAPAVAPDPLPASGCTLCWCLDLKRMTEVQFLIGFCVSTCGYPFCIAIIGSLYSKVLGRRPQGLYMGLLTMSGSCARVIGPILFTRIYQGRTRFIKLTNSVHGYCGWHFNIKSFSLQ